MQNNTSIVVNWISRIIILHIANTTEAIGINGAWLFYLQKAEIL